MTELPKLNGRKREEKILSNFRGLNERAAISDGEWADCENISTEALPAVSVRDGYTAFWESTASGSCRARAKQNIMIIEERSADSVRITAYFQKAPGEVTEQVLFEEEPAGFRLVDFEQYGGRLVLLCFKGDGKTPCLYSIDPEGEESSVEYSLSSLFEGRTADGIIGLLSFGSRMALLEKGRININYANDLSRWTAYLAGDTIAAACSDLLIQSDGGDFTGCAAFKNRPIFFKEYAMYQLYGDYTPFSLSKIDLIGCRRPETIAVCNGALYFLSDNGVMAYTGGQPVLISEKISLDLSDPGIRYACADSRFYYIGGYVYDTVEKAWSKQGEGRASIQPQCCFDRAVYLLISGESDGRIVKSDPTVLSCWSMTSKEFSAEPGRSILLSEAALSCVQSSCREIWLEVCTDGGAFRRVYEWQEGEAMAGRIKMLLPPCRRFRFRIGGVGKAVLYGLSFRFRRLGGAV